jgi:dihydropteroate synthase
VFDPPPRTETVQVMGIVNVTPDSFSDGGRYLDPEAARARVRQMVDEGATWIDVGGESTRPGAEPIDPAEECRRVLPVLEAVADDVTAAGVRLSIDTRNAPTARAAVDAGATLINDVSASLWSVAAECEVGWVAMHMAGDPATMQRNPRYQDVVAQVRAFLAERAELAERAGVREIYVDPGIGFGKTTRHNMELLAHLDLLVGDGRPVLIGTSRKRFTAELLERSDAADPPPEHAGPRAGAPVIGVTERVDGSLATATWAMVAGARVVRAHDVAVTVQAATIVSGGF